MKPVLGMFWEEDPEKQPGEDHDFRFKPIHDLENETYTSFLEARREILDFQTYSQILRFVRWNFREYYVTINNYFAAHIKQDEIYLSHYPIILGVNRCLLNLLSSIRTFLDHTETRLKRRYGEGSEIYLNFGRYRRTAYDKNFSYRFLYKLRDYAQHCGLPIDSVVFETISNPRKPDYILGSLEIGIKKEKILENFKWKKLRSELEEQPEIIDINIHINRVVTLIENMKTDVLTDEMPHLINSAEKVKNLFDLVNDNSGGTPCIFELPSKDKLKVGGSNLKVVEIPIDGANAILQNASTAII